MTRDEVNQKHLEIAGAYARVFATADGKKILEDLEQKTLFRRYLAKQGELTLAMRAGAADLVIQIRQQIALGNKTIGD